MGKDMKLANTVLLEINEKCYLVFADQMIVIRTYYFYLFVRHLFVPDNTQVCVCRFSSAKYIARYVVPRKHFFEIFFSINSKASTLE